MRRAIGVSEIMEMYGCQRSEGYRIFREAKKWCIENDYYFTKSKVAEIAVLTTNKL